jgi:hypothetical protein
MEVEMLKERKNEWETQAEELAESIEEVEKVARGGIEGVLSELGSVRWVCLALSLILAVFTA